MAVLKLARSGALLIDEKGDIALHYRCIGAGWNGRLTDPRAVSLRTPDTPEIQS